MRGLALWFSSTGLSVLLHAGAAAGLAILFAPRPVDQQPAGKAELSLSTMNVPESEATERTPSSYTVESSTFAAQGLGPRTIPRTTARATPLDAPRPEPVAPAASPADATNVQPARLAAAIPARTASGNLATNALAEAAPSVATIPQIAPVANEQRTAVILSDPQSESRPVALPQTVLITTVDPDPRPTPTLDIPATAAPSAIAALTRLNAVTAPQNPVSATEAVTTRAPNAVIPAETPARLTARSDPLLSEKFEGDTAPEVDLPTGPVPTVLAWSGTLTLDVPQVTIEAAAALRLPPDASQTEGLRDALAERLADVDCARVQTVYNPETGAIDLRGHVRNDRDRATLIDRVNSELEGSLPLNDRLRQLDAPQCTVLVRLAEMPLPQSVEQLVNPLIIGADLQTRTYSYADSQRMHFDLAGADYDAWLYLDYYDSDGQVLHLLPNEFIDPIFLAAKAPFVFGDGSDRDPARGKFEMRVSPPFGQDIAVAIVANKPLFEAPRPTVESAATYLKDLAERLETLRRSRPEFKGEWVYLFIETNP